MVLEAVNNTYVFATHNFFFGVYGVINKRHYEPSDVSMWGYYCSGHRNELKNLQEPLYTSQLIDVLFRVIYDGVQYEVSLIHRSRRHKLYKLHTIL